MCARPWTVGAAAQQREHRPHVDHGRREQRLADARAAERRRALVEVPVGDPPRERVAVRVKAARGQADQHVAGRAALAGRRSRRARRCRSRCPRARSRRARGGRGSARGARRARRRGSRRPASSAPRARPTRDLLERRRVGALDGDVVEHRDRLGADADDVVDVHRDAVDADACRAARSARRGSASSRRRRSRARARARARPRARSRSGRRAAASATGARVSIARSTSTIARDAAVGLARCRRRRAA